jgi:hypothetical protein
VGGVIFRQYNPGSCVHADYGLSHVRQYGEDVRAGNPMTFWIREDYAYSSLLHESGHASFGLREEYCPGANEDDKLHSNAFNSLQACTDKSADPDKQSKCRPISGCTEGRWKADPDDDPMTLTVTGTQFGRDCQRRAQCFVEAIPRGDCP